jgi:RNA polymerase sigma-70 factor (sigma-E family)
VGDAPEADSAALDPTGGDSDPAAAIASQTATTQARAVEAQAGIDELYRKHGLGLVRLALMLVGDQPTAEDAVQDAFVSLCQGWDRLRDPANVLAYLRAAVVYRCRSVQRGRNRARLLQVPHEPPVWSAETAVVDGEDRRRLLTAVASLPPRQREVLALKYYADLAEAQIADVLHVSRGTVSSTASRALATLARKLDAHLPEEHQ